MARAAVLPLGFDCQVTSGALGRANDLMAGKLVLPPHAAATLPSNPTWSENPFKDVNWEYQYQTLRFTWDLFAGWSQTGDTAMLDRALYLLKDWTIDNPRNAGRSPYSWNDHSTAWRTLVLACAYEVRPSTWLRNALTLHATTLADPTFYRFHGNHALNQARGLLAVGCVLARQDWKDLARSRLGTLVSESIDSQGVINEQSVQYQGYNYQMYGKAKDELRHCGQAVPSGFSRLALMTDFMGHATLPDRTYAMLGDTSLNFGQNVPGTIAEYAATAGASGPRPTTRFKLYKAGYVFGRTGWGTSRPYASERMWTARFGPGRIWHGHNDHGAVTLYGYGRRLVDDGGIFSANPGAFRSFAVGRAAHNVVTVDGVAYDTTATATVTRVVRGTLFDDVTLRDPGYPGATLTRRVVFSHELGWMYVDDRVSSSVVRTYRQLWHLEPGANPTLSWHTLKTAFSGGNVSIVQLAAADQIRFIKGRADPVQGWMSKTINNWTAAVTVETTARGSKVRFLTLLIPKPTAGTAVRVTDKTITADGGKFTVWVGATRERVVINAASVTVTQLD